jgi:hypothetical protein
VVITTAGTASAQLCGDVNNDGLVSVADISQLSQYLLSDGPIASLSNADVDFYRGVTINDLDYLTQFLIFGGPPLACNGDSCYDYRYSMEDTVVIPVAQCVLDSPTFRMKVVTKFSAAVEAFYLPVGMLQQGSNGLLVPTAVANFGGPQISGAINTAGTTAILAGVDFTPGAYAGTNTYFEINYTRVGPGNGTITTGPDDLDFGRRFAVRKNGDLYRPVVMFDMVEDFPQGDLNCDCRENITDLTLLVNHLFVGFLPLPNCPWFPL